MNNLHHLRTAFAILACLSACSHLAAAALGPAHHALKPVGNARNDNGVTFPIIRDSAVEYLDSGATPARLWPGVGLRFIQYDPVQQETQRQLDEAKRLAEEAKKREEELKRLADEVKEREAETRKREEESQQRLKDVQEMTTESQRRLEAIKQAQLEADPAYREQREREERAAEQARQWEREKQEAERKAIQALIERTFMAPPEGNYICSYTRYDVDTGITVESKGFFALNSDGTYRWLGNGPGGLYRYDSTKKQFTFQSGPLAYPGVVAKFDNRGVRGVSTKPIIILTFQTPATLAGKAVPIEWLCEWKKY